MTFWTLGRVADALGRGPAGGAPLGAIATDTRAMQRDDVFVALRGERFDAHEFVDEAVARGAAGLIVCDARRAAHSGVPVYEVPDTLVALGALARYRRRAWARPVIAVAGSNGKTSTKELLRAALGVRFVVHATTGNLNNRVGVPLTLLAVPDDADLAVVEIGTSLPGEVAILREIAEPDLAIVTSVGEEHLEGLGDLAGVLREECAVFDAVHTAVAPAGQPEIVAEARRRARRTVVAGLDAGDVRPGAWGLESDGIGWLRFTERTVRLPLRGEHHLRNAMLAIATAGVCGVRESEAAQALGAMQPPPMRTAWEQLGALTVLNDAYNANPASAREIIKLLARLDGSRQRVLVLGTMRELGSRSAELHREIARLAVESTVDVVAGIGEFAAPLAELSGGAGRAVVTAVDVDDLWPRLAPRVAPDAVVALKASRGVRLERLVPHLRAISAARDPA